MPEKQYFEGIDVKSGSTVITSVDVADSEARADLADLEDYVEGIAPVALSVTENGTYTAPTGVFGYSPVTVNVPYTASVEYVDYISFANRSKATTDRKFFVELPYTLNADHKITVDFNTSETYNNQAVIGNSAGANYIHLTQYNSKWYTSSGTSEINFSESTTGKHTFVVNDNGHLTFDGTNVASYTPTTNNNIGYWLPSRNDSSGYLPFTGYIYSYKIESISNGTVICELKPVKLTVRHNDAVLETLYGFIDIINDVFYMVEIN